MGRVELPLGLLATTLVLFLIAFVNLFTKKDATIFGTTFTVIFFALFTYSERKYAKQQEENQIEANPEPNDPFRETSRDRFRFQAGEELLPQALETGLGCCLVSVSDPGDLRAINKILSADIGEKTVVATYVGPVSPQSVKQSPEDDHAVDNRLKDVFSEVVFSAEKLGRPVKLLAIPSDNPVDGILEAAQSLAASEIWLGTSDAREASDQISEIQERWNPLARQVRRSGSCSSTGLTMNLSNRGFKTELPQKFDDRAQATDDPDPEGILQSALPKD